MTRCCFYKYYRVTTVRVKFFNKNLLGACLQEVYKCIAFVEHCQSLSAIQMMNYFSQRHKLHLLISGPNRLTQCCTKFKPFGNKAFCFRNFYGKPYWTKVVEIFLFKLRFFIQVKNFFFKVRVSIFKSRSSLFKLRCFKWRFFSMSRFLSQVENFFARRDFFFLSRIFSCQGISVQVEILIFFHVEIFQFKSTFFNSRRDVCLDSLLVFPALDNHVIYGGKHHGGR